MALTNVIDSHLISWQGRWSATAPITSAWGASVLLFKTDAPKIILRTGGGSHESSVDSIRFGKRVVPCVIFWRAGNGGIQKSLISGQKEILLYDGPSIEGGQVIELVFGENGGHLELDQLLVSDGHSLLPLSPTSGSKPLRLLFIGASQTTGVSTPDVYPPPLPFGSFTGWPLLFTRDLRSTGSEVFTTVVARPGIRLIDGLWDGREFPGKDKKVWDGWEGVGGFESRKGGLEAEYADVFFICIGSNDISSGISASQFLEVLKNFFIALVARLSPPLRHIVFVAPFGFHSRTSDRSWSRTGVFESEIEQMVNTLSKEWENKGGVEQVWYVGTAGWLDGSLCPDMLHPNEEGNRVIAKKLRERCGANLSNVF